MYRAWRRLPEGARDALLTGLSPSELHSVLMGVARSRAEAVTAAEVVRRWETDPLVRPATADPRRIARVEYELWRLLPDDVQGVELSPVAPLGTCAAVAPVGQDRIVTTMRGSEVVSDNTNALAVEAAVRRRRQASTEEVHLAACHPVLRAQPFGAGASQHFRLFALVSSARDTGSRHTQIRLLHRHLRFWQEALGSLATDTRPRIEVSVFDDPVFSEQLSDTVLTPLADPHVPVVPAAQQDPRRHYYNAVSVRAVLGKGDTEIGDGGGTTWTATLTGNAKERCMVSVLATQRLAAALQQTDEREP